MGAAEHVGEGKRAEEAEYFPGKPCQLVFLVRWQSVTVEQHWAAWPNSAPLWGIVQLFSNYSVGFISPFANRSVSLKGDESSNSYVSMLLGRENSN